MTRLASVVTLLLARLACLALGHPWTIAYTHFGRVGTCRRCGLLLVQPR